MLFQVNIDFLKRFSIYIRQTNLKDKSLQIFIDCNHFSTTCSIIVDNLQQTIWLYLSLTTPPDLHLYKTGFLFT